MRLQDRLPDGVTVDGKFYKLDFDFRNVLNMMHELTREDVMPEAMVYRALKCLTKHPKNVDKVLAAVNDLLFDNEPKRDAQKLTDFEQDAGLIRAAFRQAFNIDLYRDRLHWLEFVELLNAIPEGSRYSEVIGIRAKPIPAATKWNAEERQWLMKAKADVALRLSDDEQSKQYDKDVEKIFTGLLGIIRGKDG
jgi:hypothetical protein